MSDAQTLATWVPLLEYKRHGIAEVVVHGAISWVSGQDVLHEIGGQDLIFGRSLTKPYQMKVVAKELDAVLTPEAKALSVASHMSEIPQLKALETILDSKKFELITTPESMPLAPVAGIKDASRLYHPCSGKHAAILKACEINSWPVDGYTEPSHPYHQMYVTELRKVLGSEWTAKVMAKDGCGLPTLSMTVTELAKLYAGLAATKNDDWVWDSMTAFPEIVGGVHRLDTAILKAGHGKVLAKEGADGLLGLAIEHPDFANGLGVVIKIAHGWDPKATWFLASAILRSLGFSFANPSKLDRQAAFVSSGIVPINLASRLQTLLQEDLSLEVDDHWT